MEPINTTLGNLGAKSLMERIRWMEENPPDGLVATESEEARNLDELCERCGGLVHDDSEAEGKRCRCDGALSRCREHVEGADPRSVMTFESLDVAKDPSLRRAASIARRVAVGEVQGLAMFGTPGNGKTHAAVAACRLALSRKHMAGYYNVVELVGRVQKTYGRDWHAETRASVIAQAASRELVVLDDLGKERSSEDIASIIYELVNAVYCSGRRLIVCSNLDAGAYKDRYDEAVASRIAGMCEVVAVTGDDRRRGVRTGAR